MKIFYTLDAIPNSENSIFLAGPTYRVGKQDDLLSSNGSWRNEAIKYLEELNFTGNVFAPEYKDNIQPEDYTYSRQVSWEQKAMKQASVILFWIPRDKENLPGFTTNIEFGEWLHSGKIVVGAPEDAFNNKYLRERCLHLGINWYPVLKNAIQEVIDKIEKGKMSKIFFTSDTHFGEERTMQLSKRPFQSIAEMDCTMIKNWNSVVTNNDIVYHLGDFGDPKMIKYLNAKEIYLVRGNYDKTEVLEELVSEVRDRVVLLDEGFETLQNNLIYKLVHYPTSTVMTEKFYLYGHIHKLQMVKKNGLNVGVDCHNFTPISLADVEFYRNAIENHYDENVFC